MIERDTPGDKAQDWHGTIPDGDADRFGDFAQQVNRFQKDFARRGDGQARRGFHVKSHAGLLGEFRVLADIPAAAKRGIFASPRRFKAWVRLSNGFSNAKADWFPDLLGCSVKLEGVEGSKLVPGETHALTQDFLALNQSYLPADDAAQLMVISLATGNLLTAPFRLIGGLGLRKALRVIGWTLGWTPRRLLLRSAVTEDYYGIAPISIGDTPVKFAWISRQGWRPRGKGWRNFLRSDLQQRLAEGDLAFDFMVQFHVDAAKTPIDGGFPWKHAPWVKLAELVIPRCDLDAEESTARENYLNGLSFNPWHALVEHRPVGNIQRARGLIYQRSAEYRGRSAEPEAKE
ncbi:MAG: Catalase [Rhizorhabdus sp.]|nr:Catalase [Rhizorhabdus sp.]